MEPVLRQIANLWTLVRHPSRETEWTLDEKLRAIKDAASWFTWASDLPLGQYSRTKPFRFSLAPRCCGLFVSVK